MQTEKHPFFGKYEVLDQVGEGGFGRVVKARHRILGRMFAVKQLAPGLVSSEADYTRFTREAHAMAQLDHPNIVRVYDADVESGFPYIAMEFIDGEDVEKLITAEGPLPIREAVRLGWEIASALAHMHEHGIVHRDVKSSNIMRRATDGSFFLTDFGLALQEGTARITTELMGSREFMSPEQINGLAVPQTDQYGLGVVLFEALTGRKPFTTEGSHEAALVLLLQRVLHEPAPRVSTFRDGVPEWLAELVARCLMKQPEERYPDMRALERILRSGSPAPPRTFALPVEPEPPPAAPPQPEAGRGGEVKPLAGPLPGGAEPQRERASALQSVPPDPPAGRPAWAPAGGSARPGPAPRAITQREGRRSLLPALGALLLLVLGGVGYLALVNRAGDEEEQAHDLPAAEPSEQAGETVSDEGDEADGAVSADDGVAVLEDEAASPPEEPAVETDEEPVAAPEAPPAREPAADPPPPPSEPVPISPDEARAVADSYLQAGAGASSADVSEMYADRVNYYRRGTVSRAAVMEDKSYYFRQWPERSYERLSDVVVEQTAEGAKLRFNYAFEVEGGERGVRGEGWTELTFRREGEALRIVGENGGVRSRRTF